MPGVEIIPDLWIGSLAAYNNSKFQEDNNISCLINCCKDLHFLGKYREYNMPIKNTMEKYEIDKMYEYLIEVTEFIHQNIIDNKVILIYCDNGIQKSPTIAIAYLMRYGKLPKDLAIKSVKSKKPDVFKPFLDFNYSLDKFEKDIRFRNL